jgi:hypothetical protein
MKIGRKRQREEEGRDENVEEADKQRKREGTQASKHTQK